jgi:addiction module RelE/StbE family toxin
MSSAIVANRRFRKAIEKLRHSGQKMLVKAAEEAVHLLALADEDISSRRELEQEWRDHSLVGDLDGARELHLAQDALLLYRRHKKQKLIELLDILTHEELRKM